MSDVEISDMRSPSEFKGISFSKFKLTDVKKELLAALLHSRIEQSCYWCAEIICAGHFVELWNLILTFYSKYIQLGNTKLAIYLELRLNNFIQIVKSGYTTNEIQMRNHPKIRTLFCELMCILCESKRKHPFVDSKVSKNDFDLAILNEKLKAPSIEYASSCFLKEDPKDLFICINELSYSLSEKQDILASCYWIEWLIEYSKTSKKNKKTIICERRAHVNVDSKFQMDFIWVVWDLFISEANKKDKMCQKIVNSLFQLFILQYKPSVVSKRKHLLYMVATMLCEKQNYNKEIVDNKQKEQFKTYIDNINLIYSQIKKNEISPGTDYLFHDSKTKNLQDTIQKMEQLNNFSETFIPRI